MLNIELAKKLILDLIRSKPKQFPTILRCYHKEIYEHLIKAYPQLAGHPISEYCYWFIYGLTEFPKCQICGKAIKFSSFKHGYSKYCCTSCMNKSAEHKKSVENSLVEHYGVTCPAKSKEVMQKMKDTCMKKYGYENACLSPEIIKKIQETTEKRYGVKNYTQTKQYLEDVKKISQEKYHVNFFTQAKSVKDKIKKRMIEKYGCDCSWKSEEIKKQIKAKLLDEYGSETPPSWYYSYDNKSFDSGWELAYYIWLTDNKINFIFHPHPPLKFMFNGKLHKYYPDFKLDSGYVEIKGNQFFKNNNVNEVMVCPYNHSSDALEEAKHQYMLKNNVKILTKIDMLPILKYISEKYGKNYLKLFRKIE
jgi:hypothetical protein